jgi:arylsulfatase A-like enzyme
MTERKDPPYGARGVARLRVAAQVAGVVAIAFGVFADLLRGGSPGMGLKQWAIVLAGAALFTAARLDRTRRERLRAWAADHADAMSLPHIALLALVIGLAGGLAEVIVIAVDRFVVHGFVRVGPSAAWMVPAMNAAILVAVALLIWLCARLWPKLATPSFVGFVLVLIAADALLHRVRVHGRVSTEAKLILLVAFAWTFGRFVARRWGASATSRVRVAAGFALLVALLGAAAALQPWWKERASLATLPAPPAGRVNLVFIILDTVRAASLGLYGYARETTPELDRFAAGGVVFERAIAPSSWTLPSHGSMFTGRHPSELRVDWLTPMDNAFPTVAEALAAGGYATAAFSANVGYVSIEAGLARGFARFEDFVPTPGEVVRTSVMLARVLTPFRLQDVVEDDDRGRRTAADINGAFLSWLERRPDDRPYFAFLNYYDAHAPYYGPAPYDTLFGGTRRLKPWGPRLNAEEVQAWVDAYDRSLVYLDAQLGELFRALEQRGDLRNTVVMISSDHGEHFGENSFMGHATTLYRPVLEVPLVVRGAGIPAGVRVRSLVGLRDVAASLLDLAGVPQGDIPGGSLAGTWSGAPVDAPVYSELGRGLRIPQHYPNARHALWSIYQGDLHYIASSSGQEELYAVPSDPGEEHNLMAMTPLAAEAVSFRSLLRTHFDATGQQPELTVARAGERR